MFEEFFRKCEIRDPEKITTEQSENIKAALREKLAAEASQPKISDKEKEDNIMKSKAIRTFIIAAAVAVAGLGAAVGATGGFLTREEAVVEVANKNNGTPEFAEEEAELTAGIKEETGEEVRISPSYYVVTEYVSSVYKGLFDEDLPGIVLEHVQENGLPDVASLIKSDGSGGYLYDGELITDEKLLAAITEGTKKYGDTFVILC